MQKNREITQCDFPVNVDALLCRSELAREKPESTAGSQASSVIVDDHREQARSYRFSA